MMSQHDLSVMLVFMERIFMNALLLLSCCGIVCFIFRKKIRKFLSGKIVTESKMLPAVSAAVPDTLQTGLLCIDFMCFNPKDFSDTGSMSDAVSVALNKKLMELHNRNITPVVDFTATGFVVAFKITYQL